MAGMTFDQFKQCCKFKETWTWKRGMLRSYNRLRIYMHGGRDSRISPKNYAAFLGSIGGTALTIVLGKIAKIPASEVAGAYATLLSAVLAGIAVRTFMDILGRCAIQDVEQIIA
jgi:hypothetical protein